MNPMLLSNFADWCQGFLIGDDTVATGFAWDSSQVQPGDLFLAIKGARVDGHAFVGEALAGGAVAALVERPVHGRHILVPNLVEALAHFGRARRGHFDHPVVGVTGSAGKTTTKEFIAAALSPLGPILKTSGNRNTEYTSPLIWAEADDQAAAVIELSMRGFGQIAHLASICQPTVGVITNIGYAHLELVHNREGIARAKGELFEALPTDGLAVWWEEDDFSNALHAEAGFRPKATFGFAEHSTCRITRYETVGFERALVEGEVRGKKWVAVSPIIGRHIALNVAAAILVADSLGVEPRDAADAMRDVELPPMRMEWQDRDGVRILVDTYNASPPSTIAAIETLASLPIEGRRLAVIGEMRELGDYSEVGHRDVGRAIATHAIDEVIFVGEPTQWSLDEVVKNGFASAKAHLAASIDDVRTFIHSARPGDAILVKGSRALELERAL